MTEQEFFSEGERQKENFNPVELTSAEDLKAFELLQRQIFGFTSEDAASEDDTAGRVAERTKREIEYTGGRVGCFAIKHNGEIIAGGSLRVSIDDQGVWEGNLFSDYVVDDWRGRGLNGKIMEARILKARDFGCKAVSIENSIDNPVGLVSKFNQGFILDNFLEREDNGRGLLELHKYLDREQTVGESKAEVGVRPEWRELSFDNMEAIKFWLETRMWIGIDIKNLGAADNNDPKNWVLIMEKKAEDAKTGD